MSVIFPAAYFYPEQYASRQMNLELLETMAGAGIAVTVVAPSPTRDVSPETARPYVRQRFDSAFGGKLEILRFPMLRERKSVPLRAARYLLCHLFQYVMASGRRDAELLFAVSTPPTQGLLAAWLKKRLKIPFVYNLQDIFPDSLVSAGLTHRGSLLWKLGRRLEDTVYRSADKIIVISDAFMENLTAKGVPAQKLAVIQNWVDADAVAPVPRAENKLYEELDIPRDGFYVTYAGNFGEAQGVETILRAADLLENRKRISFLLFGGGARLLELERLAKALPLSNTRIFPFQPQSRVSEVYGLGDVSIVICKKGAGKNAVPSKTWSILAAGRPVLASFDQDGALCRMLSENGCGVCVPPEDPEALAGAILSMYEDTEKLKAMGENGRRLSLSRPGRDEAVRRYIEVFESVLPGGFAGGYRKDVKT